jgi:hypothetical protein
VNMLHLLLQTSQPAVTSARPWGLVCLCVVAIAYFVLLLILLFRD